MSGSAAGGTSRREFLIFFYKYRSRLVLSFLLPLCIAIGISFIPTPRYKATSVLIVRLGSEYVYQPETGNGQAGGNASLPFASEQVFKSEVAILGSEDLHRQVISAIGVDTLFPEMDHPQGFALFMATAHKLVDNELRVLGLAPEVLKLTPAQIEQRRLDRAVQMFDNHFDILLERESAVISVSFEHRDSAIAIKALNTLLALYYDKRKQIYIEPRAELAETQMQATHDHALAAERAVEDYKLRHQIYSLEEQRRQILADRAEAQRQAQAISDPALDGKIREYSYELDQLDVKERGFMTLQKESDIANESYTLNSHRLDEAKAYDDLQHERIGSVRIIQPPTTPPEPKKLQLLIIVAGAFVSLIFMLMVAALTEFSRRGFLAPEQIERNLGLPVLAVIPYHRRR